MTSLDKPRFPLLAQKDMSAAQQELYKRRMVGPWADLRGPFNAFMRNPAMADKALELGNHIRHGNSLPDRLVELAILVTGRHWTAQYEWWAHYKRAKEAGLPMHIADAIAENRRPAGMQPEEELVATCGFYVLISMVLNVARAGIPGGEEPPLK